MAKNIVVCGDGREDEGGLVDESNLFKLCRHNRDNENLVTYYDQIFRDRPAS